MTTWKKEVLDSYGPESINLSYYIDYILFTSYLVKTGYSTRHKRSFEPSTFASAGNTRTINLRDSPRGTPFAEFYKYYKTIFNSYINSLKSPMTLAPELFWDRLFHGPEFVRRDLNNLTPRFVTFHMYCAQTSLNFSPGMSFTFAALGDYGNLISDIRNLPGRDTRSAYDAYDLIHREFIAALRSANKIFSDAYNSIAETLNNGCLPETELSFWSNTKSIIPAGGIIPTWLFFFLYSTFREVITLNGPYLNPAATKTFIFEKLLTMSDFWNVNKITALPELEPER